MAPRGRAPSSWCLEDLNPRASQVAVSPLLQSVSRVRAHGTPTSTRKPDAAPATPDSRRVSARVPRARFTSFSSLFFFCRSPPDAPSRLPK